MHTADLNTPALTTAEPSLDQVIAQGQVWQGKHWHAAQPVTIPTGHTALDNLFAGKGWPQGALTEVLYQQAGIGEMRLLIPALAELSQQSRWIMMIAPPFLPNAAALEAAGVDTSKLLIIRPESVRDLLWTLEESLRTGSCSAVMAWPNTLSSTETRRLQLAAETGKTLGFLFRPIATAQETSPAAVRVELQPSTQGTEVKVLKRRAGWPSEPLQLDLGFNDLAKPAIKPAPAKAAVVRGPWH
ncbi:translesion DNA synthesis-associated protein ImuA [Salinispirillum sp. LH 10-3-1]|uniref:Translesion DNA synthesis-associated protein ImuA n=1 Tax=Salinispirillum sp. LH 10-3-1 TaxID=2952525 RepID=A0AB38YBS5_9GAMM